MTHRMEPARSFAWCLLPFVLGMCVVPLADAASPNTPVVTRTSPVQTAITKSAQSNHYMFIFFWKQNDTQSQQAHGVFQTFVDRMQGAVDSVGVQVTDPQEQGIVEKFGVNRAPMPLVLALAPNGAVTKGIPAPLTEQDLEKAIVSPCMAQCLKALQDKKLVLLCVGNQRTQHFPAAIQGARHFQADARFINSAEVVALNPDEQTEASFLRDLQVDPRASVATTVLLAPPGQPIARFAGAVSKEQIVEKLAAAQSSSCPGGTCGPGGCGPQR